MINFNGTLVAKETALLGVENRGFKYGDGLFETIKVEDGKVRFMEDHYFRLMASMRMIRMEIPIEFSLDFMEGEILKVLEANHLRNARIRFSVYRSGGGLYTPETQELLVKTYLEYEVDIFKDFYVYSGLLSTVKSTNKLTNVLAATYASENDLNNCILINEQKKVVEFTNGNLFLVIGNEIVTPKLTDGCVKGIVRKKLLENPQLVEGFQIVEKSISPFDLQKGKELFLTNAISGVQAITKYRKKSYTTEIVARIKEELNKLV